MIFFGSTAGGILIGLAASLTMKFAHIHDPLLASGTFIVRLHRCCLNVPVHVPVQFCRLHLDIIDASIRIYVNARRV